MNTIKYYLLILFIGAGLAACSSDKEEEGYQFTAPDMGALFLTAPQLNDEIPVIVTRAGDFSMLDPENFIIEIYKQGETSYYKRYNSFSALKQEGMPLELPVGVYTVKAFSYDSIPVLTEQPYFMGEVTLNIEAYRVTAVSIECKYQSVGVEIRLTDAFLNFFHDTYTVTVQQDMEGASAVYSKSDNGRIYFTKNCDYFLKLTIQCTGKNNYVYNPYVYYLNKDADDPLFDNDAPYKGEYFIVTIGTDNDNELTVRSTLVQ